MSRFNSCVRKGSRLPAFEALEDRRLLSVSLQPPGSVPILNPIATPTPISATPMLRGTVVNAEAGEEFHAVIGTIARPWKSSQAGTIEGSIDWGDGTAATPAVFVRQANGAIAVEGTHTYAATGSNAITITITRGPYPGTLTPIILVGTIHSKANVISSPGGVTISAVARSPFNGVVGSFSSQLSDLAMTATINWGDGYSSIGNIVAIPSTGPGIGGGGFEVIGAHTYRNTGSHLVHVTVTARPVPTPGEPTTTTSIIIVAQIQSVAEVLPGLAVVPLTT